MTFLKNNILIGDLIFIGINILINFILYLINIRFRLWAIILIILIAIIGFIIGIIQQIFLSSDNKKKAAIISFIGIIPIIVSIYSFFPFIKLVGFLYYNPEHTTTLDSKKYVAVTSSFFSVHVDYYDYYGFLLTGTKVRVHGDFGKGSYDPFTSPNAPDKVTYTYYDNNGKKTYQKTEFFIKDKDGNITSKNILE